MFVIQSLAYPSWHNKWVPTKLRFNTLQEAQAAFDALPFKADHRIAKEYTVTRYKPIKAAMQLRKER